ncbi:uncharacterized protein LOC114754132 isoform X2 [Neltuma alba]|uniref:uncharacterized protein LOC114754132 isoform X2 n=1 Tax=Neltuma alba TaxID=207710 RepID=UPI0010A403CA|nr:uncharacterized protein LOC114754132 isoform X2 [Prosopis alba]
MPLYDCMLLFKPHLKKEPIMDLVARVGKHVYRRNGVLTDIKSFGTVQLGYGVKKLDGRYYQNKFKIGKNTTCRAHLVDDGPFSVAIGACMLTSLLFPVSDGQQEEDGDSAIDGTDTRRYAVYALVYLAPYLRSNLSLSPEESWLPIASIIFCIIHIQLEASIRNGDIQGFQIFREVSNQISSAKRKKDHLNQKEEMSQGSKKENRNLPPVQEQSRDIGDWEDPQRSTSFHQKTTNDNLLEDDDDNSKH